MQLLELSSKEYVMLTTYKDNGDSIPTVVWVAKDNECLVVSTSKTLKENGLSEIEKIMDVQSKLIVNRSSYKTKTNEIESIISNFKSCVK